MSEQPQQVQPNKGQARQIRSRGVPQLFWRIIVFLIAFFMPMLILTGLVVFFAYSWGVIIWSDYYLLLCGIPVVWFIVSWIIAANAHVVPDNQRLVVFRMGKRRPKALGPGRVQLAPFIDEIVNIVDRRQITIPVRFNKVPLLTSAGEGYILCDPELQLFITYMEGREHLSVLEVQDLGRQIEAQAGGSVRAVTTKYNIDQAQRKSPEMIGDIEDSINNIAYAWGIEVRIEISDWNFPEVLVQAWTESEQAETSAKAQQVQAAARTAIVREYLNAAQGFVDDDASKKEIGQVALRLYMADIARSFSEGGGALPHLNLSDFLKAQE